LERLKVKRSLSDVLKEHTFPLMSLPGVIGTAEGLHEGEPCFLVLVIEITDKLRKLLPDEFDGYKVVISETGEIKAL
jgi:hypothetical protein